MTVTFMRTSGRTSAASVPSEQATITISWLAASETMTCVMSGLIARAAVSARFSNSSFFTVTQPSSGLVAGYKAAGFGVAIALRLPLPP